MKNFYSGIVLLLVLFMVPVVGWGQTLYDSYTDGDFTATPVWGGNTTLWTIVANSDVAAGTTGSNTLRLNASATATTDYLSGQVASWSTSQEWGFFLGRRAQAFTAANQQYFWLYANESTLNNATVDGYRIAIGDDVGGDDIRLEYIVNGVVSATVITSSGSITNGLLDIGFLVRVTRSTLGVWTLYSSTLPTATGNGAIATDIPSAANTTVNQGSATHNTLVPAANGFIGVAALHSTGASAIVNAEFDQIYFTPSCTSQTISGLLATDTKTYGNAPFALSATATSTLAVSYTSSNTAVATISSSTVTIVGAGTTTITASQAGDATYCPATNVTQTLTVNPKVLTISSLTANNKVFDGTTTATLSGTATLIGIVGSDVVTITGTPIANFNNATVGTGKPVTVTGFTLGGANAGNYTVTQPTGLTADITPAPDVDFCNIQSPGNGSMTIAGTFDIYAQAYEPGLTEAAGAGAGLNAWIGYSTINQDPTIGAWTWVAATFNTQVLNNDEFKVTLSGLPTGTYYYASRFQINTGGYKYGGYSGTGGGIWTAGFNVNGILTVDKVDFCNIQTPATGTNVAGNNFNVYAQVYEAGVTPGAGAQGPGIEAWIGYNTTNNHPNSVGWTWVVANFNSAGGGTNNDEYSLNLGGVPALANPGTYYYASRFRLNNGAFDYGGILSNGTAGSFWDGVTYISGVLTVTGPEINIQGNSNTIPDGTAATSTTNNTDFGTICEASSTVVNSFVIQNTGSSALAIGTITIAGTNAADFTVTTAPASSVASGASTTFNVTFNPSGPGARTTSISIANDDLNENPYDFVLSGTGTAASTPAVSIAANPSGPICAGINVTFTPTPTNGGAAPTYRWWKNGIGSGTDLGVSATYSSSTLANGDVIACVMTSNAACVFSTTANSNNITLVVNPITVPSVSIAITTGANPTCTGNTLTFTPTPVNGGTPTYRWWKNGIGTGTDLGISATYSSSTLANGDAIACVMTSTATCTSPATANSNSITIINNTPAAPTGTAAQTFCLAATVADLTATGTAIKWYSAASGGTLYTAGTSLVSGTHYYASQTVSGCESVLRFDVTATAAATLNYGTVSSSTAANHIVISQVYGGGGNTSAQYNRDFVELYNPTGSTVSLAGWSIQYASTAGTFASNSTGALAGSIGPGKYYLIQMTTAGATGAALPTPDFTVSSAVDMSAANGKLALVNNTTLLGGNCPSGSSIVDFVGYGSADCYEGSSAAPAGSNTLSNFRNNSGCTDTDISSADFSTAVPSPRNGATTAYFCTGSTAQTICSGSIPSAMSVVGSAGSGSFNYQWYSQNGIVSCPTGTVLTSWTSLGSTNGANTATYTPIAGIVTNISYACFVTPGGTPTCGTGAWATGCRQVTINSVTAGTVAGNQSICANGDPVAFTETVAATGTVLTYQWQSSTVSDFSSSVTTIAGATSSTYDVPAGLMVTTYYRRITTSTLNSIACTATSNTITVTILATPATPAGTINGTNPACTSTTLSYSAPSATTYWQTISNGTSNINNTLTALPVSTSGNYYVTAYNGTCWSIGQASIAVVINSQPAISVQPTDQTVTSPNTAVFTLTASVAPTSYQWQRFNGTIWTDLTNTAPYSGVLTNTLTVSPTNISYDSYVFRCVLKATAPCTDVISSSAILTVSEGPCITEGFAAGITAPAGWTFTGISNTYTTVSNYGAASPSLEFDATSDRVISYSLGTTASQLSFWIKGQGTSGSSLLVEGFNGSAWVSIQNITAIPTTGTTFLYDITTTPALPSGIIQFRFTYSKSAGNLSFDDVVVSCTPIVCNPLQTITGFSPTQGPQGTLVTITGTGFTGTVTVTFGGILSSLVTVVNSTTLTAVVPSNALSGKVGVTVAGCEKLSTADFTMLTTNANCGANAGTNGLIISEVFDSKVGSLSYIEIFNPTAAGISLTNYSLRITSDGPTNTDFSLGSSIIAQGAVFVVSIGNPATNGSTVCPVSVSLPYNAGSGFNGNDRVILRLSGADHDVVDNPNYGGSNPPSGDNRRGFSQVRNAGIVSPVTTYNSTQWTIADPESCSHLGTAPAAVSTTNVTINVQPTTVDCNTVTFTVNATGTPVIAATGGYTWRYQSPGSASWLLVSSLDGTNSLTVIGAGTNTISISGNTAILKDYQFYVEIETSGSPSCHRFSKAVQYLYSTRLIYKSIASGDWTNPAKWQMSNDGTVYVNACTYPIALNSSEVIISAGTNIVLPVNVDIDKITIKNTGTLEIGTGSLLTVFDSTASGADFIINGTLIDRGSTGNGIAFGPGATWLLGSIVGDIGTIIKTNTSSVATYRSNYEGGISTISPNSYWYFRYNGDGDPSVAATNMFYPNLYFESVSGAYDWNTSFTAFTGGTGGFATVQGSLYIGTTGTGAVSVYNNNINIQPMLIKGGLSVAAGSTLTNVSYDNTTVAGTRGDGTGFEIKGNLIVDGTFTNNGASRLLGNLIFSGTGTQNISGLLSGTLNLEDVAINNTTAAANVTVNKNFEIPGTLSFGSTASRLSFGSGNITLKSSLARTANVDKIPSLPVPTTIIDYSGGAGRFIVERYINTGTGPGQHARSWQFLATPTVGQNIKDSWQEGGDDLITGYGTQITGPNPGKLINGIDSYTINPSLKYFNNVTGTWVGITNTISTLINNPKGYMLFVRGDRKSIVTPTYQPPPVPTVLKTTGTIYQPSALAPNITGIPANSYQSVGNPYASPISLEYLMYTSGFNNLENAVSVWDPSMYGYYAVGGYQYITKISGVFKPMPGGTSIYPTGVAFQDIQSGQAFFVKATVAPGSIIFSENAKSSTNHLVNFAPGENNPGLSSVVSRELPSNNNIGTRQLFYTSMFTSTGIIADGNAVAFDRIYDNSIDANDVSKLYNSGENFGMLRNGRWLAIEARSPVRKTDTLFYSMYNLRQQNYQLRFAPENMQRNNLNAFLIDNYLNSRTPISLTDSSFVNIQISAAAGSSKPDRFYLVFESKQTTEPTNPRRSAELLNSPVITKNEGDAAASVSVYPNPIVNKMMHLQFINKSTGRYSILLNNQQGQQLYKETIQINASNSSRALQLPKRLASGTYQLTVAGLDGKVNILNVVIQ